MPELDPVTGRRSRQKADIIERLARGPRPTADGYIAAAHDFAMSSRDTSAFAAAGLTVINPWTAIPSR